MLASHYDKAPVIIIDEYDTPIQEGYSKDFYDLSLIHISLQESSRSAEAWCSHRPGNHLRVHRLDSLRTVSYTHLDVYKRQNMSFVFILRLEVFMHG